MGDPYYQAHLLLRVGYSHGFVTGKEEFISYSRQSLKLARRIGDLFDEANALNNLGWVSFHTGDYTGAGRYARGAIAVSRRMENRMILAISLANLGLFHVLQGRLEEAREVTAEGLRIAEDNETALTQAYGLAALSILASMDSDYEQGRRLASESQELNTNPVGHYLGHWAMAISLVGLGKTNQAWQQSASAFELCVRGGWDVHATWVLPVVVIILAGQRQPERAVEILSLYYNNPKRPEGFVEKWPLLNEWETWLQKNLAADGYQAAWERGRTIDLMTTVEALLADGKT